MTHKDTLTDFEHIISRLEYPLSKDDIVDAVRTHGTTNSAVALAQQLPSEIFASQASVLACAKDLLKIEQLSE